MNQPDPNDRQPAPKGARCEAHRLVYYRYLPCSKPAKIMEGGKCYCGVHDPQRKRSREAAKRREIEARQEVLDRQARERDHASKVRSAERKVLEAAEAWADATDWTSALDSLLGAVAALRAVRAEPPKEDP